MTHQSLRQLQRDWDDLGAIDPLWAILWDPARRHGGWDLAAFLATGEREIAQLMRRAEAFGRPVGRNRALDFGCGVGRLTRPLSLRFGVVVGVDISITMVEEARRLNADRPGCTFVHSAQPDLSIFGDASFELVYTNIVLQHLPSRSMAEGYIEELIRVLAPGGLLAFQLAGPIPLRHRIRPRQRVYHALRALGLRPSLLLGSLELNPIRMIGVPETRVVQVVAAAGGRVLGIDVKAVGTSSMQDRTYFVTR